MTGQLSLASNVLAAPMLRDALLRAAERTALPPEVCGRSPIPDCDRDIGYYHAAVTEPEYGCGLAASVQEVELALEQLVTDGALEQRRHYYGATEPTARDIRTARKRWRTGEHGDYLGFKYIYLEATPCPQQPLMSIST